MSVPQKTSGPVASGPLASALLSRMPHDSIGYRRVTPTVTGALYSRCVGGDQCRRIVRIERASMGVGGGVAGGAGWPTQHATSDATSRTMHVASSGEL